MIRNEDWRVNAFYERNINEEIAVTECEECGHAIFSGEDVYIFHSHPIHEDCLESYFENCLVSGWEGFGV